MNIEIERIKEEQEKNKEATKRKTINRINKVFKSFSTPINNKIYE
jgi:hypothetical protein